MAIEESSVVAASAKSASFWLNRGGFKSKVLSKTKIGHVHFAWYGEYERLTSSSFNRVKPQLLAGTDELTCKHARQGWRDTGHPIGQQIRFGTKLLSIA